MPKLMHFAAAMFAALLVTGITALADPNADMIKFGQALAAAKSYHMSVTTDSGRTIEMDYVAPNRWHMVMGGGMEAVMIQPDMWVHVNGNWMHLSGGMGAGRMQGMVSSVQSASDYKNDDVIRDLGMKDGYHAYDITHKGDSTHSIVYLMPNSLPAKIESFQDGKKSTIVYSNFDSPSITVAPPAQ